MLGAGEPGLARQPCAARRLRCCQHPADGAAGGAGPGAASLWVQSSQQLCGPTGFWGFMIEVVHRSLTQPWPLAVPQQGPHHGELNPSCTPCPLPPVRDPLPCSAHGSMLQ